MIDPAADDFYLRLIDLRNEIKAKLKPAVGHEAVELETAQQFLKILANATSYGIFAEINVTELDEPEKRSCYGPTGEPFPISTAKIEEPGRYFHPLLATLTTGGARLMLAIAETLASREGLDWAFCDTDSMALAKPETMTDDAFYRAAQAVREWFTPLNPYQKKEPLFKLEDPNYGLGGSGLTDTLEPLFCLAISDKRYALFNIGPDGRPIIRKASAHGLGHMLAPYGEDSTPTTIPKPAVELDDIVVERWQHDFWYQIIVAALDGHPDRVDLSGLPNIAKPVASRYGATTPRLLKWFKKYNEKRPEDQQVGPFNFMLAHQVSPHRFAMSRQSGFFELGNSGQAKKSSIPKPVAPYDTDTIRASKNCFDRETGEPVSVDVLKTYQEALAQYPLHPETKFLNGEPYDRGPTRRRHIDVVGINCIGKEANRWEEQWHLGLDLDAQINYGILPNGPGQLQAALKGVDRLLSHREIAKRAGVSRATLAKLLSGKAVRHPERIVRRVLDVVRAAEGGEGRQGPS
jgi:hypothetical protein